ncbi:MAG TPA: carboxypeptidase-like regulatory domain-containing protein [Clostridiales bacterium]|nr:carboxypeptidase-like regulatory domain-containing protein [Clostridiales bacterium]HQP69482.1 carboxypeptidase-like regulatory domain-containing protein [Clostridiales bacterium]
MRSFFTTLVLITASAAFSYGIIKGTVVNPENVPMPEANVTLSGTNIGSATDDTGRYLIKNIPAGIYNVKCSFIGHQDVYLKSLMVQDDSVRVVDFLMFPMEYQLPEISAEQDKEDINSIIRFRDLAQMELIQEMMVAEPELKGKIDVKTKPGFWEMLRYYIYRIFN